MVTSGYAPSDGARGGPLKVVHILAPARFGGLESVVHTLATGQQRAGHHVTVVGVFTGTPAGHPFWSSIDASAGLRAIPIVVSARDYVRERRAVRAILQDTAPDVLHTHGYRPDVLAAPQARREGVATVTTVHGFSGGSMKNRLYEWLQRRAFRTFDGVVAVSARLGEELVGTGVPADIVSSVPNAWSLPGAPLSRYAARQRLQLPQDVPVIGWVGRMNQAKAPDVMLEAFASVEDSRPLLSLVGDGPLRPSLELRVGREAAGSRVRWHGEVSQAGRLLPAFDALAITSRTEGTPMVLLEAMAAGVPIVTTAVGGIPAVVSSSEAVLVEPGDAQGIARALDVIVAGDPSAHERAQAARARLDRDFAVEPWVERYDEIYRSCLTR